MKTFGQRASKLICRIDVSAFVGIMFALILMFFVGESTVYSPRSYLALPMFHHSKEMLGATRDDALTVAVMRDGIFYFGSDRIRPEELSFAIEKDLRAGAPRKLYIRTDPKTRYYYIKQVIDSAHDAGITDVGFISEPIQLRR